MKKIRMLGRSFMKRILCSVFFLTSSPSIALTELDAEDLADLTAVFVFLKNDCGYRHLADTRIRLALILFSRGRSWDLSNYHHYDMKNMSEEGYRDLKGISISKDKKCASLRHHMSELIASATARSYPER